MAVIGGGPAGAAVAIGLARRGLPVVMIERGPRPGDTPGETLPPAVRPVLQRLGLWEAFLADRPLPSYGNRSVWGDDRPADHDFIRDPNGPGWRVDRPAFDARLRREAEAAGARCLERAEVAGVERGAAGVWRLAIASAEAVGRGRGIEDRIEARFLVDATGRRARLARRLGARRRPVDHLIGVVAFLTPRQEILEDAATLVEAQPDGWWYSAVLPDGRLTTAFFTDSDLLAARPIRTRAGWQARLGESLHTLDRVKLNGYCLDDPPRVVAAGSAILDPIAGDGWLAAGDAAVSFDPLSSHGIGSALASGDQAAEAIARHLTGDIMAIPEYCAGRRRAFDRYLWLRRAYYADERRWPEAPFWRRRNRPIV